MDIRTLSVGFISLGLFFGAGALVLAGPSHAVRLGVAKTSLSTTARADDDADDADDAKDLKDLNELEDLDDTEDAPIPFDQAPAPVQAAALKLAGDANNIAQVTREEFDDNVYIYEIEFTENGAQCSAEFTADGGLIEMEKAIDAAKLPPAALKALKDEYPDATFNHVMIVTKVVYKVIIKQRDEEHEITVAPSGDIEEDDSCEGDADAEHDDDDDHGEGHGEGHGTPTPTPTPSSAPGSHSDPA